MSDEERPLGDDGTTTTEQPAAVRLPSLSTAAIETPLDLDEVMSQARLVEKKGRICLRGDLQADYDETLEELLGLVDADGRLIDDEDATLSDGKAARAQELNDRLADIKAQMTAAMRVVRFRAMPDDDWRPWEKAQLDTNGEYKDPEKSNTELISLTAISPTMTVAQVEALRKKVGPTQIAELANAAYRACTTGGVDVPKSLHFSPAQRRDRSGKN